jgi:tetratricopeptide (TPR) repeat protein
VTAAFAELDSFELLPSDSVYEKAMEWLIQGDQGKAEEILRAAGDGAAQHPKGMFLRGVCARSRWMKKEAWDIFASVRQLAPNSVEGKCSELMISLDQPPQNDNLYNELYALHLKHPDDLLVLWVTAIASREMAQSGAALLAGRTQEYAKNGAECYEKLFEQMEECPVMIHHTYANLLTENLNRREEALMHREIALRISPRGWTHQGMANTLSRLGRYDEADQHFEKCISLNPDSVSYWRSWAGSMKERGDKKQAYEVYKRAITLFPDAVMLIGSGRRLAEDLDEIRDFMKHLKSARQQRKM